MRKISAIVVFSSLGILVGASACGSSTDGSDVNGSGGSSSAGTGGSVTGGSGPGGAATGGSAQAGSSSGGSGGALNPGGELSVDDYCKGIVAAFCDTQYECCGKDDGKRQQCMGKHVDECIKSLNQQLKSGTIEYHGEYAAACAEETKEQFACQMDLQNGGGTGPNCDATIEGLVTENGTCTNDDQCVDGLKCNEKQNSAGICYKPAAKGQPCGEGCATGLVCLNDVCSDPLPLGAKCTAADQCGADNYCDGIQLFPPGGEGVCAPKKDVGEPCDPKGFGLDCKDFMCDPGSQTCSDRMRDICQYT